MVCQRLFDAPSLFVFTLFTLPIMHFSVYVLERFLAISAYVLEEKSLFSAYVLERFRVISAYVLENIIIYTLIIQLDTEV